MTTVVMTPEADIRGQSPGPGKQQLPPLDRLELEARVREILNRWPAVGLALGVVRIIQLTLQDGRPPALWAQPYRLGVRM